MIKIEIDCREKYILKDFLSRDLDIYKDKIEIISKNLELADMIIIIESINKTFYFERKTLYDLTSSITDGRYKEQKKRLLSNIDPNNITYIIEGDTINKSLLRNNTSIPSVYFRTLYRDNIKIIFTNNIGQFANIIYEKLAKACLGWRAGEGLLQQTYTRSCRFCKLFRRKFVRE